MRSDVPLHQHWRDLYRFRLLILLTAAAAAGGAWWFSQQVTPFYEAKVSFYMAANASEPVYISAEPDRSDGVLLPIPEEKAAALDVGIIRGREVMGRLAEETGVPIAELRKRTDVVVNGEFMIDVFVRDPDPERATEIANALPEVYRSFHNEILRERSFRVAEALTARLEVLDAQWDRLDAARRALRTGSFSTADGGALSAIQERRTSRIAQIEALETQLDELVARLAALDTMIAEEGAVFAAGETVESTPALDLLLERVLELRVDLAAVTDGPQSPRRRAIDDQINEIEAQMAAERQKLADSVAKPEGSLYEALRLERATVRATIAGLEAARDGATEGLALLDSAFADSVGTVAASDRISNELVAVQTQIQNAQRNLASAELQAANAQAPLVITETASVPTRPVFPLPILNAVVAGITGLLFGAYYALLVAHSDRARKARQALEVDIPAFTTDELKELRMRWRKDEPLVLRGEADV
jgi:uncharacterized protein involved in exopolysaccharide biosynthesis